MTRTLTLLRHAKSAWPDGVPDLERPLGDRGVREAPLAGRWLAENVPDLRFVACSTAVRARQTWELVSAELATRPEVRHHAKIYYGPLVEVVRDLPAQVTSALVVGHNPDMEDLAEHLTGTAVTFKTSTLAVLRSDSPWSDVGSGWGELVTTVTPRG
ncbi:SixA phosphatase family protein [Kibdelosporangium phytohabitans]|uniref:Histidine phosphatase n=1 Tax=Kibdelosporangium phytohabitans TaxID=860235 RepID=A0A0N9IFA1_9PSEU|nr:histidine phosphatase family protein [Kibdelosporangium phytohabitans]ALG14133.1 histidine phosphatase [Kibdelosporangium phytohabitans]MBE1466881.1 phosphohistidine phosphatase [Kibdelosporangium phytohabitans]